LAERDLEPHVAHDRGHHRPALERALALQVARGQEENVVALHHESGGRGRARRKRTGSPPTTSPVDSARMQRSPSPSKARPRSAPTSFTFWATVSGCVAPHPALMLRPSGWWWRAVTRAPSSSKSRGARNEVAPLAQ